MTPIEELIHEYEVEKNNPFFAKKLKEIYEREKQEQAQERAHALAEIYDLESETIKLNKIIMLRELEIKNLRGGRLTQCATSPMT